MQDAQPPWTEVLRHPSARVAQASGLVYSSVGIPWRLRHEHGLHVVEVPSERAVQAVEELRAYTEENRGWPPPEPEPPPVASSPVGAAFGAVVYGAVLSVVHLAVVQGWMASSIRDRGVAHAAAMLDGHWWRAWTALTLHGDAVHLMGNVFFGGLFGGLAARSLGGGTTWLLVVLAGGLGNVLNAVVQDGDHRSVGASTAVFAAVGLLSATIWRQRRAEHAWRRRAPLLVGLWILAFLGTSGERTDVLGHCFGLLCGVGVGTIWNSQLLTRDRTAQALAGLLALALLAFAWALALP